MSVRSQRVLWGLGGLAQIGADFVSLPRPSREISRIWCMYIVQRAGIVSVGSRICSGEDAMMTITPLCFALCSAQILYLFD